MIDIHIQILSNGQMNFASNLTAQHPLFFVGVLEQVQQALMLQAPTVSPGSDIVVPQMVMPAVRK